MQELSPESECIYFDAIDVTVIYFMRRILLYFGMYDIYNDVYFRYVDIIILYIIH